MWQTLRPIVVVFGLLTLVTGAAYPLLITGVARGAAPSSSAGSLVYVNGEPVASELVGQAFTQPGYMWGRPSAVGYDASTSGGTNLGPTNKALLKAVTSRVAALRAAGDVDVGPIPVDLVTASGSGLDPDVSVAAARYQVARIARARGVAVAEVERVVDSQIVRRALGFMSEPRVNVVRTNLALNLAFGPLSQAAPTTP